MFIDEFEHARILKKIIRLERETREQQEEINKLEEYKKASILVISELVKGKDDKNAGTTIAEMFNTTKNNEESQK